MLLYPDFILVLGQWLKVLKPKDQMIAIAEYAILPGKVFNIMSENTVRISCVVEAQKPSCAPQDFKQLYRK